MDVLTARQQIKDAQALLDQALTNLEISPSLPSVPTVRVAIGESVQAAYDSLVESGGILRLEVGGTARPHVGVLRLRARPVDAKQITFTSDTETLPPPGTRITREALDGLAVLQSRTVTTSTVVGDNRSRNVAFIGLGLGFPVTPSYGIVYLGGDQNALKTPEDCPDGYMFDRCVFFGDPVKGCHQGLNVGAQHVVVTECAFHDIFEVGRDSQCIAGRNGGRYLLIENCFLEGGAENVMFGGADSASSEMMTSDVIIRRCTFSKNHQWMQLAAQPSIKCLFEIKAARRVLVEQCLFEFNWARDWSTGVAIMLKACNQSGRETWATCEDVTIQNCVIRTVGSPFGVIGKNDSAQVSDWMRRVAIKNVLAHTINVAPYTGTGHGCPVANGAEEYFTLDHVTMHINQHSWMDFRTDSGILTSPGKLILTNSVVAESSYGYISAKNGIGYAATAKDWTSMQIEGNAFKQGSRTQGTLPPNNLRVPPANWDASFAPDHSILPGSAVAQVQTTDGKLPGVDLTQIQL